MALAKEQDAHLIGIAFAPNALLPLCGADVGFADMSGVLGDVKAQGEAALKSFEACAAAAGAKAEGRLMQGMSENKHVGWPHAYPSRVGRVACLREA